MIDRAISVLGGLAVSALTMGGVSAQEEAQSLFDRDRNTAVTERQHPGYTSEGIQRGAFLLRPGFALGVNRVSNVFASTSAAQDDVMIELTPSLGVQTTWSRHSLNAAGSVTRKQFFEFDNENVWNWELEGGGRLDITRDASLSAGLGHQSLTEARTEAGAASTTREPIAYTNSRAFVSGRNVVGRILVQGEVGLRTLDYDDQTLLGGGVADQDFRDYTRYEIMARSDYAISPDTALFGRLRLNERRYDLNPPDVALLRDSSGYTLDVGADFDILGIARGLVGIGYTSQAYDDVTLPDISGASVDGQLEWFPTQLTTVTFQASREVDEAPFSGSGGFFRTSTGARVDHELRRNVILSSGFDIVRDDYQDIDRIDDRVTVDIGATYVMNRWIGLRLSWRYVEQDRGGNAAGQGYSTNSLGFSLVRP